MSKTTYCAECGEELFEFIKAIPSEGITVKVLSPHKCPDTYPDFPFKTTPKPMPEDKKKALSASFDKFKFVSKLDDLNKKSTSTIFDETGDKRPADQRRPDPANIAPAGILGALHKKV
jgi:hypothetical protein